MYAVWVKIDEALPWIELKGDYQTRREATRAANKLLKNAEIKIVKASKTKERVKALVMAK